MKLTFMIGALPMALNRTTTVARNHKHYGPSVSAYFFPPIDAPFVMRLYTPLDESFFLYCSSACTAAVDELDVGCEMAAAAPSCLSTSVAAKEMIVSDEVRMWSHEQQTNNHQRTLTWRL